MTQTAERNTPATVTPPAEEAKPAYVRNTVKGVSAFALSSYGSLKDFNSYTKNIAKAAEGTRRGTFFAFLFFSFC